jgi:biopolymer transport protein ExbD
MSTQDPNPSELQDSEIESKLAAGQRSSSRVHSTEHSDDDSINEINVTPLVDICLVLVIIFMAVSPFMVRAGILVTESKAGAATGKAALDKNVQVTLTADNKIMINNTEVAADDLGKVLKEKIRESKDGLVTVQAEKSNLVGQVVEILDIAKQMGATKVAILSKPEKEGEKAEAPPVQ